jgi:hypothetical protein
MLELLLSRRSYGPKSPVIAGSSQIYPSHRSSVVIAAARWFKGVGGEVVGVVQKPLARSTMLVLMSVMQMEVALNNFSVRSLF